MVHIPLTPKHMNSLLSLLILGIKSLRVDSLIHTKNKEHEKKKKEQEL